MSQTHRATLYVENATIVAVERFPGEQFVLRLHAPECAASAVPGSFVHVRCDAAIPMRRPLSIMRVDSNAGWIEILFKVVGGGLAMLGQRSQGDTVNLIGPIGRGFQPSPARPRSLLIGGGVGIPPMVFLAEHLHADAHAWQPLVLMGSEIPFPFAEQRSRIPCDWLDKETDRCMPLVEACGYPSRLASLAGYDGCFQGYVTELADRWLATLSASELAEVEIFSCGPTPMLKAVASLARRYGLPCQVSLEEFMACAVGGCAGCTVLVQEDDGPAMKRVCVDGPVFDAEKVFSESA